MEENLLKIVNHYGINNQLRKFNEECFELIEAIFQYEEQKRVCEEFCSRLHCDKDREHIIEEMADVTVMLNQFKKYYCITDKDLVEVTKFKIARQLERIKNETVAKNE